MRVPALAFVIVSAAACAAPIRVARPRPTPESTHFGVLCLRLRDDHACGSLGEDLAFGREVAVDRARAYPLLRRGCQAGANLGACASLSQIAAEAGDVRTVAWADSRACTLGSLLACATMADRTREAYYAAQFRALCAAPELASSAMCAARPDLAALSTR